MFNKIIVRGGGTIGNGAGTYPFAKLMVTSEKLQMTLSLIGTVVFKPADVTAIELESSAFGLQKFIRIRHTVKNYSSDILFKPIDNAEYLLERIKSLGFLLANGTLPEEVEQEINDLQASGSFPLKKGSVIAIIVCWNVLCLPALLSNTKWGLMVGFPDSMMFPLLFMFIFCLTLLLVGPIQMMVLKRAHQIEELKVGLIFIILVVSFLPAITFLLSSNG